MVSNSLTFALGPRLLKPGDEDAPENDEEEEEEDAEAEDEDQGAGNGNGHGDIADQMVSSTNAPPSCHNESSNPRTASKRRVT
jgi:hypothetical protein